MSSLRRTAILLVVLFASAEAIVRRQAEDNDDEGADLRQTGWDGTIRVKTDQCSDMASNAAAGGFCTIFEMCCNLGFDPLNGDKCTDKQLTCLGPEDAVCIWRNCTEMVTTTTTTPAPTTRALNSGPLTVLTAALALPVVWLGL